VGAEDGFLAAFYEQYRGYLYYTARKFTDSPQDCEDIIQDTMVRLLRNEENLRQLRGNQAATYLYLTVRSVFTDRQSRVREQTAEDHVLELAQVSREDGRTEDGLNAKWDAQILKQQLPQRDWQMLELKYIAGYSDQEIAAEMGCNAGSVRTLLSRVRRRAKSLLTGGTQAGKGG
jgi:RNA polymerase sigma factor (sigma-70 family)